MSERRSVIAACLGLFVAASLSLAAGGPEDAAQSAAQSWLSLVDGGNYGGSWDQAAKVLKGAVRQAEWAQMVAGTRKPLGNLKSRRLKSREYTEKAPTSARMVGGSLYTWGGNAKHVVIQFDASFASKPSAGEMVIVVQDTDGAWRVSGYSVH